jgi:DNA-binding Lrp family transcriptional regulator|tara:strand:- start:2452 stop:2898 length:447 start_codon:yes stop_codon:yes gene_type:complete
MKLSAIDKKILNILVENSRLSLRQIAKKANVSVVTVMNHMKKLEKDKVITNYTARINYEKIGYDIEVLIELRISKGKLFEVEKKIANHPNVVAIYDTTGGSDALIFARFPARRPMDNFLKKIQTLDFVERSETKLVLNTIKEGSMVIG